jgi:acetyl esterase/lipase
MKLLLAFFACALSLAAQLNYPPQMPGAHERIYRSIDGVDLRLYIFEPQGHVATDRTPAVVFFFGGGWNNGSPAQFLEQSKYLASRGMVAIAADYRVASRHGVKGYQCVEDAKAAMRWVRAHAGELGIDPNRIAAGGGSAGGHLAAATATLPLYDDPAGAKSVSVIPNALVLFNPVTVLAPAQANGKSHEPPPMQDRFGAPPESVSPYHNIGSNPPPTILFHGKADSMVRYTTAEMFCEKMIASGGRCELVGYDGKNHGFFNYGRDGNQAYVDTVRRMDRFFVALGWLTGEPTL